MAYKDSDYTVVIAVTQNQNNCAETHFGGRDMNAFVSPLAAIARALSSTSGGSIPFLGKAHEDSDHTAVIAVVH